MAHPQYGIAIKVENLSKAYRLGVIGTGTLSNDLKRWYALTRGKEDPFLKIGETNDRTAKGKTDVVWSLRNISFEIEQGEAIGIIGKNGAGKSTLLKILSRVTSPTTGKITGNGRVASLLEVGTGFHPELTGKENIYLNGAILGMRKKEIKRRFDEIVDFAGVERYINTPVKRYSSGMYVRLAFAVAAHLESEILIVDEVLAVGDAEFQKKCLGKMGEVSKGEGRTVLFVSHNMAAVKTLCSKAVMLENGILACNADVDTVVSSYLRSGSQSSNHKIFSGELSIPDVEIHELKIYAAGKDAGDPIIEGEPIEFLTSVTLKENATATYHLTYRLYNEHGEPMFTFSHARDGIKLQHGTNILICKFPDKFFNTGNFYISLLIVKNSKEVVLIENDVVSFTVIDAEQELGVWLGKTIGYLKPSFKWKYYHEPNFALRHSE